MSILLYFLLAFVVVILLLHIPQITQSIKKLKPFGKDRRTAIKNSLIILGLLIVFGLHLFGAGLIWEEVV